MSISTEEYKHTSDEDKDLLREKLDALLKAREAARPVPGVGFES